MNILVVDDEILALKSLVDVLNDVFKVELDSTNIHISDFTECKDAIEYCDRCVEEDISIEYAFLDIRMRGMLGIELAKLLKDRMMDIKIIFVTAYREYSYEAFQIHASGYIAKPASKERIIETLDSIDKSWNEQNTPGEVIIKTFGNFDIFVGDETVRFSRAKSKEILAYLVNKRGSGVTAAELCAAIYEDRLYNFSLQRQFQTAVSGMVKALRIRGIEDIIIRKRNYYAINTDKVKCDYYDYLDGDTLAVNSYRGEYMAQYAWSEFSIGALE